MQYALKYSGTRFLSINITQFPDGFLLTAMLCAMGETYRLYRL